MDEGIKSTVLALRESGMSAEDIAVALCLEAGTVDVILTAFDKPTQKVQASCGELFGREHAEMAKTVLLDLMLGAKSEKVRSEVALAVYDESMGYRKPKDAAKIVVKFHINEINDAIRKARNERTIDV